MIRAFEQVVFVLAQLRQLVGKLGVDAWWEANRCRCVVLPFPSVSRVDGVHISCLEVAVVDANEYIAVRKVLQYVGSALSAQPPKLFDRPRVLVLGTV